MNTQELERIVAEEWEDDDANKFFRLVEELVSFGVTRPLAVRCTYIDMCEYKKWRDEPEYAVRKAFNHES